MTQNTCYQKINYEFKFLIILILLICAQLLPRSNKRNDLKNQVVFIKEVDVSTLLQIEDNGGVFKEDGIIKDPIEIFKEH